MRSADIFINHIFAGQLKELASDNYVFEYDDDYCARADARPVCLAMPLTEKRYESSFLFPFFSNLLSEGENRKMQSTLLKIDENDDFGLLLETANYDTIGCVTAQPSAL